MITFCEREFGEKSLLGAFAVVDWTPDDEDRRGLTCRCAGETNRESGRFVTVGHRWIVGRACDALVHLPMSDGVAHDKSKGIANIIGHIWPVSRTFTGFGKGLIHIQMKDCLAEGKVQEGRHVIGLACPLG